MKKAFLVVLAASMLLTSGQIAEAQVKLPPASSTQHITQGLGIAKIELTYQRPNVNGRTVFGDLVPYDQVWRTGANNATTLTFDGEVSIYGRPVPAGTYALFTIPSKGDWTVILSNNASQWGAYTYSQDEDVLRFTVKPVKLKDKVETMTIAFDNVTKKSLDVVLSWENTKVSFPIEVDQDQEIAASIDAAMQGEKKPYFQAAQYYFSNDLDIQQAAAWIKEADKGNTRAPHIKYWKARILTKAGDKTGAATAAEEGIAMAKQANNAEYVKLNTEALKATK